MIRQTGSAAEFTNMQQTRGGISTRAVALNQARSPITALRGHIDYANALQCALTEVHIGLKLRLNELASDFVHNSPRFVKSGISE